MARSQYSKERTKVLRRIKALEKRGYNFPTLYDDTLELNLPNNAEELADYTIDYLYRIASYTPTSEIKDYMRSEGIELPEKGEFLSGEAGRELETRHNWKKFQSQPRQSSKQKRREKAKKEFFEDISEIKAGDELYAVSKGSYIIEDLRERISQFDYDTVLYEAKKEDPNIRVTRYYVENTKERHKNELANLLELAIEQEGEDAVALRMERNAAFIEEATHFILYGSGGDNGDNKIHSKITELAKCIKGSALTMEEAKRISEQEEALSTLETPR